MSRVGMFQSFMARTCSSSFRCPLTSSFNSSAPVSMFSSLTNRRGERTSQVAKNLFLSFATYSNENREVILNKDSLNNLLSSLGLQVGETKMNQFIARADQNNDGVISQHEFLDAYDWLLTTSPEEEDLKQVFSILDQDGNGYIETEELMSVQTTTKGRITREEAERIINDSAHAKIPGKMNFEEFSALLKNDTVLGWRLLTGFRCLFVTGGPGSGKGTLCAELCKQEPAIQHVSSGDLLRDEVNSGSPMGEELKATMAKGELVDASVVLALLDKYLSTNPGTLVLIDGFPRSLQNAVDFHENFGNADGVLAFECPDQEMVDRIVARGQTSGRVDDNAETAWNRIKIFHEMSRGPNEFYAEQNTPFYSVDATKSIDENVEYILNLPPFKGLTSSSGQ